MTSFYHPSVDLVAEAGVQHLSVEQNGYSKYYHWKKDRKSATEKKHDYNMVCMVVGR